VKLDWKEPVWNPTIREWEGYFYFGFLPGTGTKPDLYWISERMAIQYTARLSYAPYTVLGTTYSLEEAKALCEQHAEEHLEDYVLPKQTEWDRAREYARRAEP